MAERKHLTLIYQYNDNWIGGTYYILNIVKVLNLLEDASKPFLTIVYNDETAIDKIKELGYPYIDYQFFNIKFNVFERAVNKFYWKAFGKIFFKKKLAFKSIENLYPALMHINPSNVKNFWYWIPDFQERYLPHFFSEQEIKDRIKNQVYIKESGNPIVFSSYNALDDYNNFYPGNTNKKEVLNFVSMIEDGYKVIEIDYLKTKFNITKPYFIAPNQFWQHKNQVVAIKAAKILKDRGIDFQIVFTGKEFDYRNPDNVKHLKQYVADNNLESNVLFLGFIDRDEQLQLMNKSVAILQPSLFEGWSTVVEDVKALGQFIILSDIPLHREQININCDFFDPHSEDDLANKIEARLNSKVVAEETNYEYIKLEFARKIVSVF